MGIKALFTFNYGNEKMKAIEDLGYDIIFEDEKKIVYSEELSEIEVLVCYNPFITLDISKMKKLKWIQLSSAGIDQLPVNFAKGTSIIVSNNKGGYGIPMGEWVVLKILEMLKHSALLYNNQNKKIWKMDSKILELFDKTVGFIGTGNIAQQSAKRLQGFGVKILGLNTSGSTVKYFDKCFSSKDIDEMLSLSDIVVLTIPFTEDTYHLINSERISHMKGGAYFVNIARGVIVDEKALIEALQDGKISGASLDVVENEPLSKDSPLWEMKNVIITPHNSWISEKRNDRRYELVFENMKNYVEGKELKNIIDLNRGY